ncbi:MAG: STAS domain-containing protein [Parahaliea sp.]
MFEVYPLDSGIRLVGRFDAAATAHAEPYFEELVGHVDIDMLALDYISSAGLGVMLKSHKRLVGCGGGLRLIQVNPHILEILHYSGFDMLFEVLPADEWGPI